MTSTPSSRTGRRRRSARRVQASLLRVAPMGSLAAACGSEDDVTTLAWYIDPDNGVAESAILRDDDRVVVLRYDDIVLDDIDLDVVVAPEGRRLSAAPTTAVLDNLAADHVSGDRLRPSIANLPPEVVRLWDV